MDIFEKIYSGEIPSRKIYDDGEFFAILDINPLSDGHALVSPGESAEQNLRHGRCGIREILAGCEKSRKIWEEKLGCRIGFAVEGMDVPHAHIHLVPLYEAEKATKGDPLQLHHGYIL